MPKNYHCLVPKRTSLFLYSSKEIDERNDAPCAPVGVAVARLAGAPSLVALVSDHWRSLRNSLAALGQFRFPTQSHSSFTTTRCAKGVKQILFTRH